MGKKGLGQGLTRPRLSLATNIFAGDGLGDAQALDREGRHETIACQEFADAGIDNCQPRGGEGDFYFLGPSNFTASQSIPLPPPKRERALAIVKPGVDAELLEGGCRDFLHLRSFFEEGDRRGLRAEIVLTTATRASLIIPSLCSWGKTTYTGRRGK